MLRLTGARSEEAKTVRLEKTEEGIRVTIQSSKTGSRKTKSDESGNRSWTIPLESAEGRILSNIVEKFGETPAQGKTAEAIRAAWRRARTKEKLNNDSRWDLHSLRHAFTNDEKKRATEKYATEYGTDWREKLFGKNWFSNKEYRETVYGETARRLGHTNNEMVKIYG